MAKKQPKMAQIMANIIFLNSHLLPFEYLSPCQMLPHLGFKWQRKSVRTIQCYTQLKCMHYSHCHKLGLGPWPKPNFCQNNTVFLTFFYPCSTLIKKSSKLRGGGFGGTYSTHFNHQDKSFCPFYYTNNSLSILKAPSSLFVCPSVRNVFSKGQ